MARILLAMVNPIGKNFFQVFQIPSFKDAACISPVRDSLLQGSRPEQTLIEICFRKIWNFITSICCFCCKRSASSRFPPDEMKKFQIRLRTTFKSGNLSSVLGTDITYEKGKAFFNSCAVPSMKTFLHVLLEKEGEILDSWNIRIDLAMIKYFVRHYQVNVLQKDSRNRTAMHYVKTVQAFEFLQAQGVSETAVDVDGRSPQFFAESPVLAKKMLSTNQMSLKDFRWNNPLHVLSNPDLIPLYLKYVKTPNADKNTPLHLARTKAYAEALIKHGADTKAVNQKGEIPIQTAENFEVIDYLLLKNPDASQLPPVLEKAILGKRIDTIQTITKQGVPLPQQINGQPTIKLLLESSELFELAEKHPDISTYKDAIAIVLDQALHPGNYYDLHTFEKTLSKIVACNPHGHDKAYKECQEFLDKIELGAVELVKWNKGYVPFEYKTLRPFKKAYEDLRNLFSSSNN